MDQVQIPIERNDDSWRQRCNDRVERLKLKQYPSCQEELVGEKYSMIFKLEKAIQNGNVDSFVDVLEQVSLERKLHLSLILCQVARSGDSLLHEAAYLGRVKIAELIGHHFPELLTKTNIKGDTALHVAAGAKGSDVIKLVLSQYEAQSKDLKPTRLVNEYGNTPLHEAVSSEYLDAVTTLFHADKSVAYYLNKSGKSPLYLAVLTGNRKIVDLLLDAPFPDDKPLPECHGNSPLHAAIYTENAGLMEEIVAKKSELMHSRDEDGGTPLHYAATKGYVKGVRILLSKSGLSTALEWNAKGHLPIHLACKWGHVKVVKEFLEQEWLNFRVLLNEKSQNILHIAAKNGRDNVVKYLLRNTKLKNLVNEKDKDGNTPLHLASQSFYPNVLFSLSRDKRIDVNVMNNGGLTPRDIFAWRSTERTVTRGQLLSNVVLHSVGAKISEKSRSIFLEREVSRKQDWIKDRANTLLLVAMLIVTVTFAAGFTVPGGVYSSDDPNPHNRGMPVLDKRSTFQIFVLFNTVAMYSSSFGCFLLLWTLSETHGDLHLAVRCYTSAIIMVYVALATMTLAFTAAVGLFLSNVSWLATVITIIGFIFLSLTFSMTFLLTVIRHGVGIPFMHPVSELLIRMSISVYGSPPKIKKPSASQQERQE